MSRKQLGFSVVELLIIIAVVAAVGGAGYWVYKNHHKTNVANSTGSTTSSSPIGNAQPGTTQAIDNITNAAINSASGIDSQYTNSYQSDAASSNTAASNVGGAYNESTF